MELFLKKNIVKQIFENKKNEFNNSKKRCGIFGLWKGLFG
jgi:hypothetical protein